MVAHYSTMYYMYWSDKDATIFTVHLKGQCQQCMQFMDYKQCKKCLTSQAGLNARPEVKKTDWLIANIVVSWQSARLGSQ